MAIKIGSIISKYLYLLLVDTVFATSRTWLSSFNRVVLVRATSAPRSCISLSLPPSLSILVRFYWGELYGGGVRLFNSTRHEAATEDRMNENSGSKIARSFAELNCA